MATETNFDYYNGADTNLLFTITTSEADITGWTTTFAMQNGAGTTVLTVSGSVVSPGTNKQVLINLVSADTDDIAAGDYTWQLWRMDIGYRDCMAFGSVCWLNRIPAFV